MVTVDTDFLIVVLGVIKSVDPIAGVIPSLYPASSTCLVLDS